VSADDPTTWRRLGLVGGTSWVSSEHYYRVLNQSVAAAAGGLHSAPVTLWSVEFGEMARLQHAEDWAGVGRVLADAARRLVDAGCEGIALGANTTHIVADDVRAVIGDATLVDLVDATADAVAGYRTVGLLGTGFTMRSRMFPDRLGARGIDVVVPSSDDQQRVHDVVYDELTRDVVTAASEQFYLDVVAKLVAEGAEAVILGCTEQNLLLHDGDADVPFVDTTTVHCAALTAFMLGETR
jgi:aspartate racemase